MSLCETLRCDRFLITSSIYTKKINRKKKVLEHNYSPTSFLITFLQVFISKKSLYKKIPNNYERQEKPLRLIICRSRPGNDPKSFSFISLKMSVHTVCNAVFKSSVFCMFNLSSLLSTMDQIFSIIFISLLFAGHLSCIMPFFFRYSCVIYDICGPALSC